MRRSVSLACLALGLLQAFAVVADEWRFDNVSRVVAMSDVHGAFGAMIRTLENASVIDEEKRWTAGDTHLVIVGDLLDRGPDSRQAMDFLIGLESEAEVDGGKVHVLLGNHEVMNLVGDLRYVSKQEYAAFADEETAEERARWFELYRRRTSAQSPEIEVQRVSFDRNFPAGFFAHRRAFAADGKYGAWLLSKPMLIVVNDTAFVHGGLSPLTGELGLSGVNGRLHRELVAYVRKSGILQSAGVLLPTDSFYDHEKLLESYLPAPSTSAETLAAVEAVRKLGASDVHALDGPLWYRGNASCNRVVELDRLEHALSAIGAERVVIGHTPTPNRQLLKRFDGRVMEVDTGMLNAYYGGSGHALILADDETAVVSEAGADRAPLAEHPRQGGGRSAHFMTADAIEQILLNGEIRDTREDELKRRIVTLSDGRDTIEALFVKRGRRGFYPDLAAYRLDRLLKLDYVPATVRRELDGDDGTLQFLPANRMDEGQRSEAGRGGSAMCPLDVQWPAMYVFDALIYNEGRILSRILYNTETWQLILVEHQNAFSTKAGRPRHLQGQSLPLGPAWIDALQSLDEDLLERELGDALDKRRRRALLERRDELLSADVPAAAGLGNGEPSSNARIGSGHKQKNPSEQMPGG